MITLQERVHGTPPPADWQINKLRNVLRVRKGIKNAGMQEDNLLSLSYGRIVRKDIDTNEGLLPESFETYQIVEPGNIVMRLTDLQNDKRSIRQGLVTERGIITSAYDALEVGSGHDPRFWAFTLLALDLAKYYYSLGAGVRQSIKFADFPNDWIRTPCFETQKSIADFLDRETLRIDRLIQKKQSLLGLLPEKEKAEISRLVLRGINEEADMVSSKIFWRGDFPSHWTESRLKAHFKMRKRQGYEDQTVLSVYREFGVIEKSSRDDNINKTPEDLSKYQLVEPGDLVINKMKSWQGSLGISDYTGITSPDYVVMVQIGKHDSGYMHHLLRARPLPTVYHLISNGIRIDQWRMEPEKFLSLPVFLPPLHEQKEIAAAVSRALGRLRNVAEAISRSIDRLREHRASLITAAVTGQIDVASWGKEDQNGSQLDRAKEAMRA